jgi:hypothetical protein
VRKSTPAARTSHYLAAVSWPNTHTHLPPRFTQRAETCTFTPNSGLAQSKAGEGRHISRLQRFQFGALLSDDHIPQACFRWLPGRNSEG